MKAALLPIAFALTAGAAFAEGPIQGNEVFNFQSTLSRAEVQAQVAPAYRADVIARGEATPSQATVVASGLSRAQVQAEAAEAYRLGLVANGEITIGDHCAFGPRVRILTATHNYRRLDLPDEAFEFKPESRLAVMNGIQKALRGEAAFDVVNARTSRSGGRPQLRSQQKSGGIGKSVKRQQRLGSQQLGKLGPSQVWHAPFQIGFFQLGQARLRHSFGQA